MTGSAAVIPKYQFSNSTGVPLANGTLTTYLAGTTTPTATWQDQALTIANTNPVTLDSRGECILWLDNTVNYKFVLKNSAGITQWTQDNISGNGSLADTFRTDLAASSGAEMVGFQPTGTGAAGTDVATALRRHFIDADAYISPLFSASTNVAKWGEMVAYINTLSGGAEVRISRGNFLFNAGCEVPKNTNIIGEGMYSTVLSFSHVGDCLYANSPINSSTIVNNSIEKLKIVGTNVSSTGACYSDTGGSIINLDKVLVLGCKFGIVLDQSELVTINQCHITGQKAGGAGIWMVQGADRTPGAMADFTNRVTVQECQINEPSTVFGVADDGGYAHSFYNNNFNGCSTHYRSAGGDLITLQDNAFESGVGTCITFNATTLTGSAASSASSVSIRSNSIIPIFGYSCISCNFAVSPLIVENNFLGNTSAAKITGLNLVAFFYESGNQNLGGGATTSGTPTKQFRTADNGTFVPTISFGGNSVGVTYSIQSGIYTRIGDVINYCIQIALSSKGTSTGSVKLSGLPYAARSGITQGQPPPFATGIVTSTSVGSFITSGDGSITLLAANVNYGANLADTNVSSTSTFLLTGSYFAA